MNKPRPQIQCNYCSQWRRASEVIAYPGGVMRCLQCEERHDQALRFVQGRAPPPNCQECGVSFVDLSKSSPSGDIPVCLVPKDGILQVLCLKCSDAYERKRQDLFRGTRYGYEHKLA